VGRQVLEGGVDQKRKMQKKFEKYMEKRER
jgi:hypothetical protein